MERQIDPQTDRPTDRPDNVVYREVTLPKRKVRSEEKRGIGAKRVRLGRIPSAMENKLNSICG